MVHVSTPSYAGSHEEGYHATVLAMVKALAKEGPRHEAVNVIAPMGSPADLRCLKTVFRDFGLEPILLPDYSDTLDGPAWTEYQRDSARRHAARTRSAAWAAPGPPSNSARRGSEGRTAGKVLEERFGVPCHAIPLPLGVTQTDRLFDLLEELGGRPMPAHYHETARAAGRLLRRRPQVRLRQAGRWSTASRTWSWESPSLLAEIGVTPALCASGTGTGRLQKQLAAAEADLAGDMLVLEDVDFAEIEEQAARLRPTW